MTRLMRKETAVRLGSSAVPRSVLLAGNWCQVKQVLEVWKDTGCWWEGEGEKTFYRVRMEDEGMLEIYHCSDRDIWVLYRIYD